VKIEGNFLHPCPRYIILIYVYARVRVHVPAYTENTNEEMAEISRSLY